MTTEEIIAIMNKPISSSRTPQYRVIYKMATGKDWKSCMCGSGWSNFTKVCINYANALRKQRDEKLKQDEASK